MSYNPNFSLRHALIEKKWLLKKQGHRKHDTEDDGYSKKDLRVYNIDIDRLSSIIDRYGRKGSRYNRDKIDRFQLYGKGKKKSIRKKKK